jgi:histidinol phosphatase-like enzyme (inositol monophosphatase family)
MKEILEFATAIAREAAAITLKHFRTGVVVESKSDASPVTVADREAEEFLRRRIERAYPDDAILGEEFGEKTGRSGYRWILDPIDGTKSFIRGVAMYGTMVGVEKDGQNLVGVVHYPASSETLAAAAGLGCSYNGQTCRVSSTQDLRLSTALTTDLRSLLRHYGQGALRRFLTETGLQRTWGDCYGYLLVATGRADLMFDPVVNPWDVAALIPIIQEAEGRATDARGLTGTNVRSFLATNSWLHAAALEMFASPAPEDV